MNKDIRKEDNTLDYKRVIISHTTILQMHCIVRQDKVNCNYSRAKNLSQYEVQTIYARPLRNEK